MYSRVKNVTENAVSSLGERQQQRNNKAPFGKKFTEGNGTLYKAFVDVEKLFDTVPREVLFWGLRSKSWKRIV